MGMVKTALRALLARYGYSVLSAENTTYFQFEALLHHRLMQVDRFFFIEIGANDGVTNDPLYQFATEHHDRVAGIVVEPLNDAFAKLCCNYRRFPKVTPLNVAVHASAKELPLFRVDPARSAQWPGWDRRSSFDRSHFKRMKIQVPDDCIVTETVPCVSVNELFDQHGNGGVDLLQIDTEGYDAEILRSLDFGRHRPPIIRFEHNLGTPSGMSEEAFADVVRLLNRNGYQVIMELRDATACQMFMNFPGLDDAPNAPVART